MSTKSFVIIGNESLLVHCGEALRRAGHTILAIVTGSPEIGAWATSSGLRVLSGSPALREATDLRSFDVLLSVGNLEASVAVSLLMVAMAFIVLGVLRLFGGDLGR